MKTQILDINGQSIRAAIWEGDPAYRPILYLNGIGANLELAAPLAENLAHGDFITFDMPGVGLSPPSRIPYRPFWVAKLTAEVLNHLGYDQVDLMGYSWGGGMAQQFAFQYAKRVNRLVLAATSPGFTMLPGNLKTLSRLANPSLTLKEDGLSRAYEALFGEARGYSANPNVKVIAPQQIGYMMQLGAMAAWTSLPLLPFIKAPTLILTGDEDNIVPPNNSALLNSFIPRSRLKTITGANHLFVVTGAEELTPLIDDFLLECEDTAKESKTA